MSRQSDETTRRRFLRTAAVAGGAVAAATAVAGVSDAAVPDEPGTGTADAAAHKQGYRVTPHVNTYYRLARQ